MNAKQCIRLWTELNYNEGKIVMSCESDTLN